MFTLKKVKYHAGLSQETHAYTADLYLDGRKVAEVSNAGHGGCDDVYYKSSGCKQMVAEQLEKMDELPRTDREKAELIRSRIRRYADLGDAAYSHVQCDDPDPVLLAEHADLLTDSFFNADLEHICCNLVNDYLLEKDLKQSTAKRILYTIKGETGVYQTKTARNAKERDAWAHQVAEWETTDKVLNLLPAAEALAIFREAIQ